MLTNEIVFITFGALSCLCSGSVVLTGLVFTSVMLTPNNPYSNMIFIISLCILIGSISICFGYPKAYTSLCAAQSFMRLLFFPAAWIWTVALIYQLRCMILFKKLFLKMRVVHTICWSCSILIVVLPLTQNNYGQDDDLSGRVFCQLSGPSSLIWIIALYYGSLFICISLLTLWLYHIYNFVNKNQEDTLHRQRVLIRAIIWYPIGLIVCYICTVIATIFLALDESHNSIEAFEITEIISTFYGTFVAFIFFSSSKIARNKWISLIFPSSVAERISSQRITMMSSSSSITNQSDRNSIQQQHQNGFRESFLADGIWDLEMTEFQTDDKNILADVIINRESESSRISMSKIFVEIQNNLHSIIVGTTKFNSDPPPVLPTKNTSTTTTTTPTSHIDITIIKSPLQNNI